MLVGLSGVFLVGCGDDDDGDDVVIDGGRDGGRDGGSDAGRDSGRDADTEDDGGSEEDGGRDDDGGTDDDASVDDDGGTDDDASVDDDGGTDADASVADGGGEADGAVTGLCTPAGIGAACETDGSCQTGLRCYGAGANAFCSINRDCGGFVMARCPASAPYCLRPNGSDLGTCVTETEAVCICAISSAKIQAGTGTETCPAAPRP